MMNRLLIPAFVGFAYATAFPAPQETRCFELRVYYAAPGKLADLNARFRNHTVRLFEKHGMVNIGYWMPIENPENKLIYLLAFPSREAAKQSWQAFRNDPEWKEVARKTEANGRLVTKVESTYLVPTDYSPLIDPSVTAEPRVFELRTYKARPGRLADLNARFRNHTVGLFTKHGIGHFGYWISADKTQGADHTLIYILAHKSQEAAAAAFKAFRADQAWIAAKAKSEEEGPLTQPAPEGVKSLFMQPTDYSPTR